MSNFSPFSGNRSARCIIVGAGDFFGLRRNPKHGDLLIAADAGLCNIVKCGLTPDIILGDFDSLDSEDTIDFTGDKISIKKPEIIRYPIEKDDTDMILAVKEGLSRGFTEFDLYGGTGGRVDHLFANLQTLAFLSCRGASGRLYGENYIVTAVTDGYIRLSTRAGATVSVFAHGGPAEGVTLSGLKYALEGATLATDFPLGVSNIATGENAFIEVKRGTLLVVIYD
jgi:thiamine pyrophosphokinase